MLHLLGAPRLRVWAASQATEIGHGGVKTLQRATGITRATIGQGKHDTRDGVRFNADGRVCRPIGGTKKLEVLHPEIVRDCNRLVNPMTPVIRSRRSVGRRRVRRGWRKSGVIALGYPFARRRLHDCFTSVDSAGRRHARHRRASVIPIRRPGISISTQKDWPW
jgi:hypothetical protein